MTTPEKTTILNVDDQDPLRYVKTRDLRQAGFEVIEATTGAQALQMVERHAPPVALLDVNLPDISGFEVCRYVKQKWPETMVLMTSATFTSPADRSAGLDSGADSFLVQPAEPLELAAAINALLRIRRSDDELRKLNAALEMQVSSRTAELSATVSALKQSGDRLRTLFATSFIYQGYLSPDGTLLDANRASLDGIAADLRDIVGRPFWDTPWFAGTPGMPEMIREAVRRVAAGAEMQESIVVNLPTGERSFDMSMRPVKNEKGEVVGIVPEAVETTQRIKAEQALRQSQKMEAIGQLTGGLAHDFNNLLTAVVGNLDLIRQRAADARIERLANNALKAAERGSKLTSQLLAFSRTQKISTAPVDVNALITGMDELLRQSLGTNVKLRTDLAPNLPAAMADANQLELAILNLSINARDAMPDGGALAITTALAPDDAGVVTVKVTDTGSGMPPEVAARAFDPFFTTKPVGKGTGLGLSQVYGIARQGGGDVTLDSQVGKGTTVTLRLPRAADAPASQRRVAETTARALHAEKVLIVDDDPDVRDMVGGYLADLGYEVQKRAHGDAALAILPDFDPSLLIVDFVMPGMNGAELARAARQHNSGLRILFLSGFADTAALEAAVGTTPLLHKPFRLIELAATVRTMLDS
jgi:signal transduction histidine kinase/ActR/RegA family two-component response regulator